MFQGACTGRDQPQDPQAKPQPTRTAPATEAADPAHKPAPQPGGSATTGDKEPDALAKPASGTVVPCAQRASGEAYCADERTVVTCDGPVEATRRCAEHEVCTEHPADVDAGADCACAPGASPAQGCTCPAGYHESDDGMCAPVLVGLELSAGTLEPALGDRTDAYRVALPQAITAITLRPVIPDGATMAINGASVAPPGPWSTGPLAAGLNRLSLVVSEPGRGTSTYTLAVIRGQQETYLKASHPDAQDGFGAAVAISDGTIVVGAPHEGSKATTVNGDGSDNSAPESGAAYVFVRSGHSWQQQAYLKPSNGQAGDHFGASVAIAGDTIVVGAPSEDGSRTRANGHAGGNGAPGAGAAYVFVRRSETWTQQAYLKAKNAEQGDGFGTAVAVAGDTIVVGAPGERSGATRVDGNANDNSAPDSGAAYVFVRRGKSWAPQAYLKGSRSATLEYFGYSVAIAGDTAVVGIDDGGPTGGEEDAYVFARSGSAWGEQAMLDAGNPGPLYGLAASVAISGDTIVVGALETDRSDASVFVRSAGTWMKQASIRGRNAAPGALFGASVAISGDAIVVGALGARGDADARRSGDAYLFVRDQDTWIRRRHLTSSNAETFDRFGAAVGAFGDTVVVGAPGEDGKAAGVDSDDKADNSATDSGAVYVFE